MLKFNLVIIAAFALFFFVDAYKNVPEIAKDSSPVLKDLPIADVASERLGLSAQKEEILLAEDIVIQDTARPLPSLEARGGGFS